MATMIPRTQWSPWYSHGADHEAGDENSERRKSGHQTAPLMF